MNQTKNKLLEEHYLNLTTYGRKTNKSYTVELSFYNDAGKIYLLAHKRDNGLGTDWFQNLKVNPVSVIEIEGQKFDTKAVLLEENKETEDFIRTKFIEKYGQEYYNSWYSKTQRIPVVLEIVN